MAAQEIKLIRELEPYSQAELLQLFSVEKKDWAALAERLERRHILRRRTTYNDDKEGLEDTEFADHTCDEKEYSLSFVGVYVWKNNLIYSLPKYARRAFGGQRYLILKSAKENQEAFKQLAIIMQVLRRYDKTRVLERLKAATQANEDDYLALLVHIVTDYARYGLYRDDVSEEATNSRGRILWQKTIQKTSPFMQANRPCYTDLVVRRTIEDRDNFFTRLHLYIVDRCQHVLMQTGLTELLAIPQIAEEAMPEYDMGDEGFLIHRIQGELREQFDSRRRYILQLMLKYIRSITANDDKHPDELVFGSSSFHSVWEEACREVFGKDDRKLFEIAPPVWESAENTGWHQWSCSQQSLEPDIIINRQDAYWLFDAKYYLPRIQNGNASRLPGVGDVTKQFLYQQALQEQTTNSNLPVYNAFLMPLPDTESVGIERGKNQKIYSFARVGMLLFNKLGYIHTYRVHPDSLYEAYLRPEKRKAIQDEMGERLSVMDNCSHPSITHMT